MQKYQREHTEAASDISGYLANPINAYLLTKRLTTDWKQVENLMTNDFGYGRHHTQSNSMGKLNKVYIKSLLNLYSRIPRKYHQLSQCPEVSL